MVNCSWQVRLLDQDVANETRRPSCGGLTAETSKTIVLLPYAFASDASADARRCVSDDGRLFIQKFEVLDPTWFLVQTVRSQLRLSAVRVEGHCGSFSVTLRNLCLERLL